MQRGPVQQGSPVIRLAPVFLVARAREAGWRKTPRRQGAQLEFSTSIPIVDRIYGVAASRATARNLAVAAVIWAASALGVVALQSHVTANSCGRAVPDVIPFYTPHQLFDLLEEYGEPGRRAFLYFTFYDLYYPLVAYGTVLMLLCALLRPFVSRRPAWRTAVLLPIVGLAVELFEQFGFLLALGTFPSRWFPLGVALSALSAAKFILLGALLVLLGSLVGARAVLRVHRPSSRCS